jgi:NTE family protein
MSELMRAYAVLQGGGVKGAALAGAVSASHDSGIRFAGYGGTSAGAIVAALFATGYQGYEIREMLLAPAHPRKFLDDDIAASSRLSILLGLFRKARRAFGPGVGLRKIVGFWFDNRHAIDVFREMKGVGLYSGAAFAAVLEDLLRSSPVGKKMAAEPITFRALKQTDAPRLKIVAANLTTGKAIIFDADNTPDVEVVTAVRASMSYPFVFQPYVHEGQLLSDGGLASNLPVFLFQGEHIRTGYPIIGIDLAEPARDQAAGYDLIAFVDDVATCVLEASDRLFRDLVTGVDVITVEFERRISTLNFDVSAADIRAMYGWGENSAYRFLSRYQRLKIAIRSRDDKVRQLQLLFGPPKIIIPVLWAVKVGVEDRFAAKNVKVSILLPLPMEDETAWLKCYRFGYSDGDHDVEIELSSEGRAIDECVNGVYATILNLESSGMQTNPGSVVRCVAYFPISSPDAARGDARESSVRAVLRIETETAMEATGWVARSEKNDEAGAGGLEKAFVPGPISDDMFNWAATWTSILFLLARSK